MSRLSSKSRRAAEMYLAGRGEEISLRACADRYGISVGTAHAAVAQLRRERAGEASDVRWRP